MENTNPFFTKEKTKGRPRLILNDNGKKMIEKLSAVMCTDEEIAAVMDTTVETLQNAQNGISFLENKQKGRASGKASLRRAQFELAKKNASMNIWLGKQYLGQRDVIEHEVTAAPVIVVDI